MPCCFKTLEIDDHAPSPVPGPAMTAAPAIRGASAIVPRLAVERRLRRMATYRTGSPNVEAAFAAGHLDPLRRFLAFAEAASGRTIGSRTRHDDAAL